MQEALLRVEPVIDYSVRGLCVRPYPNHPKGCPNFDKRGTCPPDAPTIGQILDLQRPVYLVYNRFDFGAHVEKMRAKHPDWSQRQLENCLYWQGTARKRLKKKIYVARLKIFEVLSRPAVIPPAQGFRLEVLTVPEACGVNVTATMQKIGIQLEWPPVEYAYQVALIGVRR